MAESILLKAETRQATGTSHSAKLRKNGRVPAVVYGHKQEPVAISLNLHDFSEGLHHGHRFFDVDIDGKKDTLLVKDVQYDHLGKYIIHADLVRVDMTEAVKVTVPIELRGKAKGALEGGILDMQLMQLEVECTVANIPDSIEINIKEIDVGDAVHAGEVELPQGVKLVTNPDALVLNCHLVAAAKSTEELEEDMPSAPEVITEKAEEPGEEGESEKA